MTDRQTNGQINKTSTYRLDPRKGSSKNMMNMMFSLNSVGLLQILKQLAIQISQVPLSFEIRPEIMEDNGSTRGTLEVRPQIIDFKRKNKRANSVLLVNHII